MRHLTATSIAPSSPSSAGRGHGKVQMTPKTRKNAYAKKNERKFQQGPHLTGLQPCSKGVLSLKSLRNGTDLADQVVK